MDRLSLLLVIIGAAGIWSISMLFGHSHEPHAQVHADGASA